MIAARPYPNVAPLPVDFGVIAGTSFIRFNTREVPLYDKPNGAQVDTLSAGYTYVAVRQISDNFAEVRPGRWVDLSIARFASPSTFTGVMINGLDMPFAWVLWPHCATNAPAGARSCEGSGQLSRYQLVNIYATVNVSGWNWYLIGPGLWTNQQNVSVVYPTAPAAFGGPMGGGQHLRTKSRRVQRRHAGDGDAGVDRDRKRQVEHRHGDLYRPSEDRKRPDGWRRRG